MAALFGGVLKLCGRAGLVEPEVDSIDGTRIAGDAGPEVNHELERLAREVVAEARATDEAEDELYGEARGDELPERLCTTAGRREFFRQAGQRLREEQDSGPSEEPEAEASAELPLEFDATKIVARVQGRAGWVAGGRAPARAGSAPPRIRSLGRAASGCFWRPSWHHPRFSSGCGGVNQPHPETGPLFADLYRHGVELLLTDHSHNYQRVEPVTPEGVPDPGGVTQFVVGTGGRNLHTDTGPQLTISEVLRTDAFGVLELTLEPGAYTARFVGQGGLTLDQSSGTCHPPPQGAS